MPDKEVSTIADLVMQSIIVGLDEKSKERLVKHGIELLVKKNYNEASLLDRAIRSAVEQAAHEFAAEYFKSNPEFQAMMIAQMDAAVKISVAKDSEIRDAMARAMANILKARQNDEY